MIDRRRLLGTLAVIVGAGAVGYFATPKRDALPPGGPFTLESAAGPVTLETLKGHVGIVYFGYASCPDVCPISLGAVSAALATLPPADAAKVRVLFVSLDPERDTPASLAAYATHFDANAIGATASDAVLRDVATRYGVTYRKHGVESALGYVVDHTSQFVIVDPSGGVAEVLPHGTSAEDIAAAVRRHLGSAKPIVPAGPVAKAADALVVEEPYVRALPPGAKVSAAYFTLKNPTAVPHALVRAATPAAAVAELHAVLTENGLTEMRPVAKFDVPPNGEVALSPSGNHVMLVNVVGPLDAGGTVSLTLGFEDGSERTIEAPVR